MKKLLIGLLALGSISAFANTKIAVNAYIHHVAQSGNYFHGISPRTLEFQDQVVLAFQEKGYDVVSWKYASNSHKELKAQDFQNEDTMHFVNIRCEDKPLIKIGGCDGRSQCQVGDGFRVYNRSVTTIEYGSIQTKGRAGWNKANTSCLKATLKAIKKL